MSGKETEIVLKVLIIGDSNVGKTSFVQRYISNTFRGTYKWTVGGKVNLLFYFLLFLWLKNLCFVF